MEAASGRQGATGGLRLGSDEIPVSYLNRKQVLSTWEQDSSLGAFLKKKKNLILKPYKFLCEISQFFECLSRIQK